MDALRRSDSYRIGAVCYVNARPIIENLESRVEVGSLDLDVPSRLADDLADGKYDLALIPSVEAILRPDYQIVGDVCIATRGEILSVLLLSRVPLDAIRTLALDEGSRTSCAMAKLMLRESHSIVPKTIPLPMSVSPEDVSADAVLVIGDRALDEPSPVFRHRCDLGVWWHDWTGLPFVFAVWAARTGVDMSAAAAMLSEVRDAGLANLEAIATREAPRLKLTEERCLVYLRDHLCYTLDAPCQAGLDRFAELLLEDADE